ncbi:PREDICTED: ATP synthase subunit epsilon, mitochondrial [Chaetura pelagica]|uniref:ATP synthase subunit epsilon, mitochondrial n=1 Tax=Chaetura pelagica TaxID=8897 RepID=UPI000523DAEB|nr:PREDICTED: ATP synthase subunit epsilon, mitochondrial [Chaetura pelagica]
MCISIMDLNLSTLQNIAGDREKVWWGKKTGKQKEWGFTLQQNTTISRTHKPSVQRGPKSPVVPQDLDRSDSHACFPAVFSPGFIYCRYSQICAQVVRAAMKPQYKAEAERAATATVKTVKPKKE